MCTEEAHTETDISAGQFAYNITSIFTKQDIAKANSVLICIKYNINSSN